MNKRKGLPGQLEREVFNALRPIFLRYLDMKKKHMSRDRIVGVMHGAFLASTVNRDKAP